VYSSLWHSLYAITNFMKEEHDTKQSYSGTGFYVVFVKRTLWKSTEPELFTYVLSMPFESLFVEKV